MRSVSLTLWCYHTQGCLIIQSKRSVSLTSWCYHTQGLPYHTVHEIRQLALPSTHHLPDTLALGVQKEQHNRERVVLSSPLTYHIMHCLIVLTIWPSPYLRWWCRRSSRSGRGSGVRGRTRRPDGPRRACKVTATATTISSSSSSSKQRNAGDDAHVVIVIVVVVVVMVVVVVSYVCVSAAAEWGRSHHHQPLDACMCNACIHDRA